MTKVIKIDSITEEKNNLKPIEFVYFIHRGNFTIESSFHKTFTKPKRYDNIILISSNFTTEMLDLMYAYDTNMNSGDLYLGRFNDGIV